MRLSINGELQHVVDGLTINGLITQLGLNQRRVAVEVNRQIIARERYGGHALTEGDEIEIVHFVGGGC